MAISDFYKKVKEMLMNKKNKKKIISAKKLQKKCQNAFFIVYVVEKGMKYEVQKEYLSSTFFQQFFDEFTDDIIIRDMKNLEFSVNRCPDDDFKYLLQFSKIQLYP